MVQEFPRQSNLNPRPPYSREHYSRERCPGEHYSSEHRLRHA